MIEVLCFGGSELLSSIETNATECPTLEMKIDIRSLEHLGLKMYYSLPAVIAEYVANSWDAKATVVEITIPDREIDDEYTITIKDNGIGMTVDEVNKKFLVVGRPKRKEEGADYVEVNGKKRMVIGRKGLGKIAGFGIAGWIEIRTVKGKAFVEFRMDYEKMEEELKEKNGSVKTTYEPEVIGWGTTDEDDGTVVRLTKLKRINRVNVHDVRENLSRHFSVFGNDFVVKVNGVPLSSAELKQQLEYVWEYHPGTLVDKGKLLTVSGWIGTMKDPVPSTVGRGIVVMARGKLVQEPSVFDVGGKGIEGQLALSYLVGEIHADFLDAEEDLIATGRRSVIWEQEPASTLRNWINAEIKNICKAWTVKRREAKMKTVKDLPSYKERILKLPKYERDLVDGLLERMAEKEDVTEEVLTDFADYVAQGIEYQSFLELMMDLEKTGADRPEKIIQFFKEWEVLDAIATIRIVEGRLEAIKKFQELVATNAKEVPTLHRFFVDNPWFLDPTWDFVDDEVRLSSLLKDKFPDDHLPEPDRRIDFLCLRYGNTMNVVELKRPEHAINRSDLEQLEYYYDHVKRMQGTDPERTYTVVGYIIGGHISSDAVEKADRLRSQSMYVRPYDKLREVAERAHKRFIEVLRNKANRIPDQRLQEGLTRISKKLEVHSNSAN